MAYGGMSGESTNRICLTIILMPSFEKSNGLRISRTNLMSNGTITEQRITATALGVNNYLLEIRNRRER